jgi:hypothetical protein
MPTRAYVAIDITASDIPSFSVVIDDTLTILKFTKTAEFILPLPKRKAIWSLEEAHSDIDLTVYPYTWWIVIDGFAQIGVTFQPAFGNSYALEIRDGRISSMTSISLAAAKQLFTSLKAMMHGIKSYLKVGSNAIFKPANNLLQYHIRSWVYREERIIDMSPQGEFPPEFS